MNVSRAPDDEGVMTLEDERATFLWAFQYIQNHTHRIVPSGSPDPLFPRHPGRQPPPASPDDVDTLECRIIPPRFPCLLRDTCKNCGARAKNRRENPAGSCNQSHCK